MLGQLMELLHYLYGIIVAVFNMAHILTYFLCATIIRGTSAVVLLLCWCACCALVRSIVEYVPVRRYVDYRLQDEFLRKVKNMGYEELNMRARLSNIGEDIKMRNKANSALLREIRNADKFIMRKVRYYEPENDAGRYDIQPVTPGRFVPRHKVPEPPSPFAIVRWWRSQDPELYRLECSVASLAAQARENKRRLLALNHEHEFMKRELSETLSRKREVQHMRDLPNYEQMYRNFEAALEVMRTPRDDLDPHQYSRACTCQQQGPPSYTGWLVPHKPLRWWEWGWLAPGQTIPQVTSLPDISQLPIHNALTFGPTPHLSTPAPSDPSFAASVASASAMSLPPLFGSPPAAVAPSPLSPSGGPPTAPVRPTTPPAPTAGLSLGDRLRDPAGLRARPPTPPPPPSPRSYRSRF